MLTPELSAFVRAQSLDRRRPHRDLLPTVRALVALQAQIPSTPHLSLAARVEDVTAAEVEGLLDSRKLLRAWCLRGTLHVVHAADFALIHAAIMRSAHQWVRRMIVRHDGLTEREVIANEKAILRALEKGPRTRADLKPVMPRGAALYWGREIRGLCCAGLVVHAGRRGGEAVFDLLERHAPNVKLDARPEREARRDLLRRYLEGYGPATPADYAYWLGIKVADAKQAFADLGRAPRVDDRPLPSAPPRLLPRFDIFVLGHRDKTRYLDAKHYKKVFKPSAVVDPVAIVDGRVVGTWAYDGALKPFGALRPAERDALRREMPTSS